MFTCKADKLCASPPCRSVPGVFNPGTTCLLLQRTSSTVLLRKQPLTGCVSGSKASGW